MSNTISSSPAASVRVPWLSLSSKCPLRTDPKDIKAYYADRKLLLRNMVFIGITNIGWAFALNIITPLIQLRLKSVGIDEGIQGWINGINLIVVSMLVMLFSWISDHTISRLGRRSPYLFMAAPAIILSKVLFPFSDVVWFLVMLQVMHLLFMDLKNSTFALINIDCFPRERLAQLASVLGIIGGLVGFGSNWVAGWLIDQGEWVPYVVSGTVMSLTTLAALGIKEPPIYHPPTEFFKPWSTFKVAFRDPRIFVLMLGVGMIMSFASTYGLYLWFWASETLHLERKDIFQAISWAGLINMGIAFPIGWIIDRYGGLKVVFVYWLLLIGCFAMVMHVQTKLGLTVLAMVQTMVFPLYTAADIMVYKCCPADEVGSITSTNSCLRNGFIGLVVNIGVSAVVVRTGHNYLLGMGLGLVLSTIGMMCFFLFAWLVRRRPLHLGEIGDAHAHAHAHAHAAPPPAVLEPADAVGEMLAVPSPSLAAAPIESSERP